MDRMEKSKDKAKWDMGGSSANRMVAFLDWLESEPKRLIEQFKKLALPVIALLSGYPQAEKLAKFLGIGKTR